MTIDIVVGILLVGQVRFYLQLLKLSGVDVLWVEGPGFIQRTFVIKAEREVLIKIKSDLEISLVSK